jgi:hypothetical protein
MASTLGDFDQAMKLVVGRARFNLKFYFNFFHVAFFVGLHMHPRSPEIDFAHARSDSERHQQASAERAEERRDGIRRGGVVTRQLPSEVTVLDLDVKRIAGSVDSNVAMGR